MAVTANSIITPQTPFSRQVVATTAEVAFTAPTTTVTLLDRADNVNGARLTRLFAIPRETIGTAINCQVYEYDGTNKRIVDSALMATVTPGASVANPKTDFGYSETNAYYVKAGVGLEVAVGLSKSVLFKAEGGLY